MNTAIVFAAAFIIRVALIHIFPQVFGGDTVLRIMNRDHILLSYQLPLLQSIVWLVSKAGGDLLAIRYSMALIGAFASAAFYQLMLSFVSPRHALLGALLFLTSPFLIQLSIVPYQEVLMLGFLSLAFHFFFRRNAPASSLSLGLACFTRYESWAACPVLIFYEIRRTGWSVRPFLVYGWAPALWLLIHLGLSPEGTFVAEAPHSWQRIFRYVYLGWIVLKNVPPPVLVLAAVGLWALIKKRMWRDANAAALGAFVALFVLSIPFSAHGESPDPERFVTARTAAILIYSFSLWAGFGVSQMNRAGTVFALVGAVWGCVLAYQFLLRDTSQPAIQLSYRLSRFLDSSVSANDKIAILTKQPPLALYLDKVRKMGGEDGVRIARERMSRIDTTPPDFQRTVIHSRLARDRFLPSLEGERPQWVAVWSDSGDKGRAWPEPPASVLVSGPLSVRVYRLP